MDKAHCEALLDHHPRVGQDGLAYCVPDSVNKHCPAIAIPNPPVPGSTDCICTPISFSSDPNDKSGTQGVGVQHVVERGTSFRCVVQFETDPAKANAAVQALDVTDQLDASKIDVDTFALGPITFGGVMVAIPP